MPRVRSNESSAAPDRSARQERADHGTHTEPSLAKYSVLRKITTNYTYVNCKISVCKSLLAAKLEQAAPTGRILRCGAEVRKRLLAGLTFRVVVSTETVGAARGCCR